MRLSAKLVEKVNHRKYGEIVINAMDKEYRVNNSSKTNDRETIIMRKRNHIFEIINRRKTETHEMVKKRWM